MRCCSGSGGSGTLNRVEVFVVDRGIADTVAVASNTCRAVTSEIERVVERISATALPRTGLNDIEAG